MASAGGQETTGTAHHRLFVHGPPAVKYHSRVRSPGLLAVLALGVACAARSSAPAVVGPPSETPMMPAMLTPPPLAPPAADARHVEPADPRSARSALRRAIFDAAWTTVRDKHYDKALGGVNWDNVRARYEPLAVGAPDEPTFYRLVNEMLGTLGQSHLEVSGPGAEAIAVAEEPPPPPARPAGEPGQPVVASGDTGDPGLLVRVIEGKPTITSVRAGSSAARAGLRPGLVVTHVGGHPLGALPPSPRPLRPVEERFRLRLQAARRLSGPVGTGVTVRYLEGERPVEVLLARDPPAGRAVQVGLLPPLYPEVRVTHAGEVGVIAFNFFLLEPVLGQVQKAIDGLRSQGARALILDLRGNPGGVGAMAIPIAARLVNKPLVLGTIQFRDYGNVLKASPSLGVTPFAGRVVLLTDEGTASTSEILAAGLQEAGRALVVGDTTLGAVLPSAIAELPGGAVMQYVVADFRTPRGILIEGRGVQPDRRVVETRAAIAAGRDAVLDAALVVARASARP
jgi:carboxyl-terminal processing protease